MRKIGILGGTFNPVHRTHVDMAKAALREGGLSEVWLMPAKIPPHKIGRDIAEESHRYNMLKLALEGESFIFPSDFELRAERISYTSDTLVLLRETYPEDKFYLIIGGDSVLYLEDWHEPQKIFDNCSILYASRVGSDSKKCQEHIENVLKKRFTGVNIRPLSFEMNDISSTNIRRLIKEGCRELEKLNICKEVLEYILENRLYF